MEKRNINRRNFLQQTGKVSLGFLGLQTFLYTSCGESTPPSPPEINPWQPKYGELLPDPKEVIKLPKGFTYKIIARKGERMSDGLLQPDKPDGMATFVGKNGRIVLVRNHELMPTNFGPFGSKDELLSQIDISKIYDFRNGNVPCYGGTTTLVINEDTLTVEKSWLSLAGTLRNCAGGPTPWGTWISCEEVVLSPGNAYAKGHGYCFEVPARSDIHVADPIPLKAMGQFNHEAICVDHRTGIVYQTEDRDDGLIYRFLPNEKGNLKKGGKLQALAIKGQKSLKTRNWKGEKDAFPKNEPLAVEWIDLENVEEVPEDDLRGRGFKKGAAIFARGEGMWFGGGEVYFACTSGGRSKTGQVFRYVPSPDEGTSNEKNNPGKLELFLEPNNTDLLKYCDNLTIAPWGDIILCEDRKYPRVVGVTQEGLFYHLAENTYYKSEFAGGVFSPSGKTYFVNIQHAGLTIAIQGPWRQRVGGSLSGL